MERMGIRRRIISVLLVVSLLLGGITVPAESSAAGNYMAFFDSQGGSYCGYRTGIGENSYIELPTPVKKGYDFKGWYTKKDYTGSPHYNYYHNVTEDMIFYAKWEKKTVVSLVVQYTGGPVIVNQYPDKKDFLVRAYYYDGTSFIVDPEDEDLELVGALIQHTGNTPNTVTVKYREAEEQVDIKGIREPIYCIGFDTMGGSFVAPIIGIAPGTYIKMPEDPVKKGYDFKGWYMEQSYKTEFTGEKAINDTFIVYAKWVEEDTSKKDTDGDGEEDEQEELTINMTQANLDIDETDCVFVNTIDPYLDVYYESSDPDVVEVDEDGIITGLRNGRATIWVYVTDGPTFKCKVGVGTKQYVTKLSTNVSSKKVKKGKTYQIKTTITPKEVSKSSISYSSSNKKIATVSSTGLVTAKKKGTCYITVKTKDGTNLKRKIKIKVI